jgi:hypothetical protein
MNTTRVPRPAPCLKSELKRTGRPPTIPLVLARMARRRHRHSVPQARSPSLQPASQGSARTAGWPWASSLELALALVIRSITCTPNETINSWGSAGVWILIEPRSRTRWGMVDRAVHRSGQGGFLLLWAPVRPVLHWQWLWWTPQAVSRRGLKFKHDEVVQKPRLVSGDALVFSLVRDASIWNCSTCARWAIRHGTRLVQRA